MWSGACVLAMDWKLTLGTKVFAQRGKVTQLFRHFHMRRKCCTSSLSGLSQIFVLIASCKGYTSKPGPGGDLDSSRFHLHQEWVFSELESLMEQQALLYYHVHLIPKDVPFLNPSELCNVLACVWIGADCKDNNAVWVWSRKYLHQKIGLQMERMTGTKYLLSTVLLTTSWHFSGYLVLNKCFQY